MARGLLGLSLSQLSFSQVICLNSIFGKLSCRFLCFSCAVSLIKTLINYCYWQFDWILFYSKNIHICLAWAEPENSRHVSISLVQIWNMYISWIKQYPVKLPVTVVNYGFYETYCIGKTYIKILINGPIKFMHFKMKGSSIFFSSSCARGKVKNYQVFWKSDDASYEEKLIQVPTFLWEVVLVISVIITSNDIKCLRNASEIEWHW